jgi:hypothetical protein
VTTDEALTIIAQQNKTLTSQNEMLIFLAARLVWKPEELVEIVMANKKKDPEAYVTVYNACDGRTTGKQLAEIAGVSQPAMSGVLQGWLEDGIVLNVGTESQPRYRRLMKLPEKRKTEKKAKQSNAEPAKTEAVQAEPIPQETEKKVEVQQ